MNDAEEMKIDRKGFLRGYAAASADTERLVRRAVEATIEEAAAKADEMTGNFADDLGYIDTSQAEMSENIVGAIHAIDVASIVARVMQEGKRE